jgi:hypothetical protein
VHIGRIDSGRVTTNLERRVTSCPDNAGNRFADSGRGSWGNLGSPALVPIERDPTILEDVMVLELRNPA